MENLPLLVLHEIWNYLEKNYLIVLRNVCKKWSIHIKPGRCNIFAMIKHGSFELLKYLDFCTDFTDEKYFLSVCKQKIYYNKISCFEFLWDKGGRPDPECFGILQDIKDEESVQWMEKHGAKKRCSWKVKIITGNEKWIDACEKGDLVTIMDNIKSDGSYKDLMSVCIKNSQFNILNYLYDKTSHFYIKNTITHLYKSCINKNDINELALDWCIKKDEKMEIFNLIPHLTENIKLLNWFKKNIKLFNSFSSCYWIYTFLHFSLNCLICLYDTGLHLDYHLFNTNIDTTSPVTSHYYGIRVDDMEKKLKWFISKNVIITDKLSELVSLSGDEDAYKFYLSLGCDLTSSSYYAVIEHGNLNTLNLLFSKVSKCSISILMNDLIKRGSIKAFDVFRKKGWFYNINLFPLLYQKDDTCNIYYPKTSQRIIKYFENYFPYFKNHPLKKFVIKSADVFRINNL